MIKLSELKAEVKKTEIIFDGLGSLNVSYRPGVVTTEFIDQHFNQQHDELDPDAHNAAFVEAVESWDLMENDEHAVEIKIERLRTVPLKITNAIMTHILEEMTPDESQKKRSGGGISRRGRRRKSLMGGICKSEN